MSLANNLCLTSMTGCSGSVYISELYLVFVGIFDPFAKFISSTSSQITRQHFTKSED